VQERVAALPGVAGAALCYEVPAFYFPTGRGFLIEGQPPPANRDNVPGAPINGITPGYFNTTGTRILAGRDFAPSDKADSPRVIIISESMARALFPSKAAVGHRLADYNEKEPVWMEIVGVVQDVRFLNPGNGGSAFQAYIPLAQNTWSYVALVVRATVPSATLIEPLRRAVGELDPDMAVKELTPVPAFIERNMLTLVAIDRLLLGFAGLGLFLAALGIYGVIARLVAQRTNEIGIRMALGAQVGQIARLILGTGMRLVAIGTGIGLLGAAAIARFFTASMPGMASNSVTAIAAAVVVLIVIALVACWLPARRATKVDPIVALRAE
jgi:predicted permease